KAAARALGMVDEGLAPVLIEADLDQLADAGRAQKRRSRGCRGGATLGPVRLERDLVVQVVEVLGAALAPAAAAAGRLARGAAPVTGVVGHRRAFVAPAEQHQFAPEALQHDLRGVALLTRLVLPFAGLQLALD